MRSSPANRLPQSDDPVVEALTALNHALARADGSDPATVEPVVHALEKTRRLLQIGRVSPAVHAEVRQGIDRALCGLAALLEQVKRERDQVGRELGRLRARPRGARPPTAHEPRIDVLT